jgi:HEAT repeats
MTAPAPSPTSLLPEESPQGGPPVDRKSRKVYILWGISLALLLSLGIFCWAVVVPVWQTRTVLESVAVPELSRAMNHGETAAFNRHVEQLGGPQPACSRLRTYLRMPETIAPRRLEAVAVLSACGGCAEDDLLDLLRHYDDDFVRAATALVLSRSTSPRTVAALTRALDDPSVKVRRCAAESLGRIGSSAGSQAVAALARALTDASPDVRGIAAAALGSIGAEAREAIPALTRALQDQSETTGVDDSSFMLDPYKENTVRDVAAEALKKIKAAQEKR